MAGGVQSVKQPVVGGDVRAGEGVEEGGFSGVGVAYDSRHRYLVLHPPLALGAPDAPDVLQFLLQFVDLPVDMPPVRLQLGLAGALGADGAFAAGAGLPLQMGPHAGQAGQQVLVLDRKSVV